MKIFVIAKDDYARGIAEEVLELGGIVATNPSINSLSTVEIVESRDSCDTQPIIDLGNLTLGSDRVMDMMEVQQYLMSRVPLIQAVITLIYVYDTEEKPELDLGWLGGYIHITYLPRSQYRTIGHASDIIVYDGEKRSIKEWYRYTFRSDDENLVDRIRETCFKLIPLPGLARSGMGQPITSRFGFPGDVTALSNGAVFLRVIGSEELAFFLGAAIYYLHRGYMSMSYDVIGSMRWDSVDDCPLLDDSLGYPMKPHTICVDNTHECDYSISANRVNPKDVAAGLLEAVPWLHATSYVASDLEYFVDMLTHIDATREDLSYIGRWGGNDQWWIAPRGDSSGSNAGYYRTDWGMFGNIYERYGIPKVTDKFDHITHTHFPHASIYRIGDAIRLRGYALKTILDQPELFGDSIATEYANRTDKRGDYKVLADLVLERSGHIVRPKNTAVLHLRIGDKNDQTQALGGRYSRELLEQCEQHDISHVEIITSIHDIRTGDDDVWRHICTQTLEILTYLTDRIGQAGLTWEVISGDSMDNDLCRMVTAEVFQETVGGVGAIANATRKELAARKES